MPSGFVIRLESNKIFIKDYNPNLTYPIQLNDEMEKVVWSNNAEDTMLDFEELKNGFIVLRDTSGTKSESVWKVPFLDPNNNEIFNQVIPDAFGGNDLNGFINSCKKELGRTQLV